MSDSHTLIVGNTPWPVTVPPERLLSVRRDAVATPTASAAELTRAALEQPFGFEPLRRALTPDDRVTIVLDPTVPRVAEVLGEVLAHLGSAGVAPQAVTVLTPSDAFRGWIDELADEYSQVLTETHDPADRNKLAYLASTQAGRRIYLNRTLVDADFAIVLTGRNYDPLTGYGGAEAAVFPALADEEARTGFAGQFSAAAVGGELWPARAESLEVLRLLGLPFLVQVIEAGGDDVQDVIVGLPDSSAEGVRRQDARWRSEVDEEADTVIAAVSGDAGRITFLDLAKAAATAARVVRKGGRIAVLTTAAPELGEGAMFLRSLDGPSGARKLLARMKPADWPAAWLWAFAARNHSLYLASAYPDEVAEELFTTPIRTQTEVQRLIDVGGKVLLIPDAHKAMIEVHPA